MNNFAFKDSNIIIEGIISKETINFNEKNLKHRKIILLLNFIFDPTFFIIALSQIFKNNAVLINHKLFFQRIDSPQLYHFQFLKINSLIAEITIEIFENKIFINKLLNLIIIDLFSKIRNGQVVENIFLDKMILHL